MRSATKTKVAAIVGPTAIGKTEASVEVARRLDAEIVSVDSMQIYVGMDIGTAKPSAAHRAAVPHHLIDLRDPRDDLSVAEYQQLARAAIAGIAARGRLPLLVGGSGLYFRAVVDDLRFPPRDRGVRSVLEAELEESGAQALFERLAELDPGAAARIEPRNDRRIVRALEVIAVTGAPFSEGGSWDRYESIYHLSIAGMTAPRAAIYERITVRAHRMVADGLADEALALAASGMGSTARQALGYRQVLEADTGSQEPAQEIARATKRFARRQESWFRADPRVFWCDALDPSLQDRLEEHFRASLALPCSR